MSDELTPSQIVEWLEEQALHLDSRHDGGDTDQEGWTYQAAMCRMIASGITAMAKTLPFNGQQFVRVSDAMVKELRDNPSRPVRVQIVGDGPELEMLFTVAEAIR